MSYDEAISYAYETTGDKAANNPSYNLWVL
jgi:hypothetical protein